MTYLKERIESCIELYSELLEKSKAETEQYTKDGLHGMAQWCKGRTSAYSSALTSFQYIKRDFFRDDDSE